MRSCMHACAAALLQVCEESGRELALAIKRKAKAKEASNSAGEWRGTL